MDMAGVGLLLISSLSRKTKQQHITHKITRRNGGMDHEDARQHNKENSRVMEDNYCKM